MRWLNLSSQYSEEKCRMLEKRYQTNSEGNMVTEGKIYAVLAAVGDYSEMNVANLPTYENDSMFMKKSLVQGLMVDEEHICILGQQGNIRVKELAITLKSFSKMLSANDTLIFYYSGHGKRQNLLFSDASIKLNSLLNYFSKIKCKSKLIILDCCHSGDFQIEGPKQMTLTDTIRSFVGRGIAIMASSAADEVSRLGIGKQCSLFTEIVGSAMMSRRRMRRGYLSLDEINNEVLCMMDIWNKQYPEKKQTPIYRGNLGGTIYFKIADYIPYKQKNIYKETAEYTIYSVKPLSTNQYKRICVFVLYDNKEYDELMLAKITREISSVVKDKNIFSSKKQEKHFANQTAHAIWCYFGKDESDLIQHLYYAYTIWARDDRAKKMYFKEYDNMQVVNGIYIKKNISYLMLKKMQVPSVSRENFILDNKRLLVEIISMAEQFIFDLKELTNKTTSITKIREEYKPWIIEVRKKYLFFSELDSVPDDLYEWTNEIANLAGWIVDLSLLLEDNVGERELWLINNAVRQYNESLIRLKSLEEKI